MMPASRRPPPQDADELEASLGRSLAETERLNRPGHRAGLQTRETVRRQTRGGRGGAGRRRAFAIAILILLAMIGLVGLLVRLGPG
jgi:hypothetical protein